MEMEGSGDQGGRVEGSRLSNIRRMKEKTKSWNPGKLKIQSLGIQRGFSYLEAERRLYLYSSTPSNYFHVFEDLSLYLLASILSSISSYITPLVTTCLSLCLIHGTPATEPAISLFPPSRLAPSTEYIVHLFSHRGLFSQFPLYSGHNGSSGGT